MVSACCPEPEVPFSSFISEPDRAGDRHTTVVAGISLHTASDEARNNEPLRLHKLGNIDCVTLVPFVLWC